MYSLRVTHRSVWSHMWFCCLSCTSAFMTSGVYLKAVLLRGEEKVEATWLWQRDEGTSLASRKPDANIQQYMRQPLEIGNVQEWCQQSPGLMQLEERRDSFQDSRQMCDGLQGLKWGHRKRNWGLSANCSPDFPPNLTHLSPATAQGLTHTSSQKIARHSQNVWELPTSTSPPRPGQSLLSAFLN